MEKLRLFNIAKRLYPTPSIMVENPAKTELVPGDVVCALIGPAAGKFGVVVVERNGNYTNSDPYCGRESIGVGFAERGKLDPKLEAIIGPPINTVVRWFDDSDQLEVVGRVFSEE